jgi:hypothetical protein
LWSGLGLPYCQEKSGLGALFSSCWCLEGLYYGISYLDVFCGMHDDSYKLIFQGFYSYFTASSSHFLSHSQSLALPVSAFSIAFIFFLRLPVTILAISQTIKQLNL